MPVPEDDIHDALVTAALGTSGVDLFKGPLRDRDGVPDATIHVMEYGGTQGEPDLGKLKEYRTRMVQVEVRSARDGYEAGVQKARAVRDALQANQPTGYVLWLASEPQFVEIDSNQRARWAIRVQCDTHD